MEWRKRGMEGLGRVRRNRKRDRKKGGGGDVERRGGEGKTR